MVFLLFNLTCSCVSYHRLTTQIDSFWPVFFLSFILNKIFSQCPDKQSFNNFRICRILVCFITKCTNPNVQVFIVDILSEMFMTSIQSFINSIILLMNTQIPFPICIVSIFRLKVIEIETIKSICFIILFVIFQLLFGMKRTNPLNGKCSIYCIHDKNISARKNNKNLIRPSRRCHGFCKAWALTLPPQSCAVKQTGRVLVLVPAGEHSACLQHRPAPSGRGHHHFSFSPYSAATLARGGNMVFGKPLLL